MTTLLRRIQRPGFWRAVLPFAIDLIVPTILFYVAIWSGVSLYLALLLSAAWSAVTAIIGWMRGDRRSGAQFMLLVALASLAVSLVTGSDRFLLARESVITALVGGWFLLSLRDERPLTYRMTRPLWEGRFGTTAVWDDLWVTSPRFRRIWRVSTIMWSAATFIDAILRVVLAYTMPVNSVPALQTGLMISTMLLMQVVTNVYYLRAGLWPLLHGAPDETDHQPQRRDRTRRRESRPRVASHPLRHS